LGIKEVPFDELNGNIQGYSIGLDFAINPLAERRNHTLFHELGHIVLGHTMPSQRAEYLSHRGIKEFEAEATSYLVAHELGQLDEASASHSRAYIQHWLDGEKPSDESIRSVFKATDAILRAGRLAARNEAQIGDV
jgi:antirestriction protein ArdC